MLLSRLIGIVLVPALLVGGGAALLGWRSEIPAITPPKAANFDRSLIRRGAQLASAGNCNTCHTRPDGPSFAGGLRITTPFGAIYTTNITPDAETGIGRWSEAAFARALREGVDRDGENLYPVFPYDHFTHLTDADIDALYAYFMTREPVRAVSTANELRFPVNYRFVIAGWKLLFFREGPLQPDAQHDAVWNRGAYLVEGLSHCGGCHTPRSSLGAERSSEPFGGGEAEGWTAYALNAQSPSPIPWDRTALVQYLRHGWHSAHGIARGPMAPVIDNLGALPDDDISAIATYVSDIAGTPTPERLQRAQAILAGTGKPEPQARAATSDSVVKATAAAATSDGAAIYAATCAPCHESGRLLPYGGINLARSTGPTGPTARNLINVVLWGLPPSNGQRSPVMPGFANALNDKQLRALVTYVRERFGSGSAWTDIDRTIRDARQGWFDVGIYPAPSSDPASAMNDEREAR